ncbi:transglycosylase SLT domain-containing protein [Aliiroseovarius sp. S1339]|uniref:transglycosylase SLT domain-containing protein n=1 Tax=Aliiroseovarius sp. S1339 TaxID=2936990 RepID=UPI0020C0BC51|nr:transglycosylase SLT domain-containing protein [Aliiroseovarius sp. S1339]MCK8462535.1 transglycosylase SLT domain-containing protein [Aliiroseovarius sp. S1339]
MKRFILGLMAAMMIAPAAKANDIFGTRGVRTPDLTMKWDEKPQASAWTDATMKALETHGAVLSQTVPADIETWCPGYESQDQVGRNAFWTGLLSTLSYYESTWRPTVVGGGGKWYGLVQILPATARGYGCEAQSGAALKKGELNLSCAVRIMAVTVPRDNVVSKGMRGVAADWGPFHSERKRNGMREWIKDQNYCAVS